MFSITGTVIAFVCGAGALFFKSEQPEQPEQSEQREQSEQPEQPEQREQSEQPEQPEQREQSEQFIQLSQFFRPSSAFWAASRVPQYSTEH
jgi:uncharacterized Zn finger protein (UPF0148 family)